MFTSGTRQAAVEKMILEVLGLLVVLTALIAGLGYWLRHELRKRIVAIMGHFEGRLSDELAVLRNDVKGLSGDVRDLQMVTVSHADTVPTAGEAINWGRWIPLAQEDRFVASFFDFGRIETIKDTTERRIRTFTMSGVLDWLGRSGRLKADVVECGCFRGHTSYVIASVLKAHQFGGRFHIFDSFEGLSDAVDKDLQPIANGPGGKELQRLYTPSAGGRLFGGDLQRVQRNLAEFDFIDYYKGWIPDRFGEVKDKTFSFVHLDVDLYEPTLAGLQFFYPRLVDGGAIIVDDYGLNSWPGCTRATNEFLANLRPTLVLNTPAGGLVIVK